MIDYLKDLCTLDATSGDEDAVRDYIISKIDGFCEWYIDNSGNIIALKKGKNRTEKKIMIDAHMDEVGFIITGITSDGFLKFENVGGIETSVMLFRRVKINGKINGVIGGKPIHLLSAEQCKKLPDKTTLYIDIGAENKDEAQRLVNLGDRAVMTSDYIEEGSLIKSKALDDRIGCAILISLLSEPSDYDFYATFTTGEEVGMRGAKTATFTVNPDSAIVLEGTTAADIAGVPEERKVCKLSCGAAVSFMDKATVYDRKYYNAALKSGIPCQAKSAVAGGNNSGAVHLNGGGVRTIAISVPCRYIHSASSVADKRDIKSAAELARYMLGYIAADTT